MVAQTPRLRLIAALLLLCFIPFPASAKENWTRVQSRNFVVVGNGSERDLRKVALRLEEFREAITRLLPKARINVSAPTTVVVFKTDDSFDEFKPRYKGKVKDKIAGYFLQGSDSNYIAMTTETGGLTNPYHVIFHEFVHFLVGNNLKDAPLWLNEGLAEFYSTFETSDDEQKVVIGKPIVWHLAALRQESLLPLKTLLTVDHKSPHYNEASKAGIFYAESWALTHYLLLGNGGKRQPQLVRFISQLGTMPLEENFRASFGADYGEIEKELYTYTQQRMSYPIIEYTLTRQLDFDRDMQSSALSEAEVKYYQGDLLARLRQTDEAESYFQKAMELDPKLAAPRVSLGILRLQQGRVAEAKELFEHAVGLDPQSYLAQTYYALSLLLDGKTDEAIKAYRTAIQLKPGALKAYVELASLYDRLGRYEEALETYNRAGRIDLRETQIYRSRGYILLRLGRGELAAVNARSFLNLEGWKEIHAPYMALLAYFGSRQAQQSDAAAKILEEALKRLDADDWPYNIFKYLHGDITAQQLLDLATDRDKRTEAHAYIGLDLSIAGRRDEALEHLRWVRENGNRNFVEYPLALAELYRLGESVDKAAPRTEAAPHPK